MCTIKLLSRHGREATVAVCNHTGEFTNPDTKCVYYINSI